MSLTTDSLLKYDKLKSRVRRNWMLYANQYARTAV